MFLYSAMQSKTARLLLIQVEHWVMGKIPYFPVISVKLSRRDWYGISLVNQVLHPRYILCPEGVISLQLAS